MQLLMYYELVMHFRLLSYKSASSRNFQEIIGVLFFHVLMCPLFTQISLPTQLLRGWFHSLPIYSLLCHLHKQSLLRLKKSCCYTFVNQCFNLTFDVITYIITLHYYYYQGSLLVFEISIPLKSLDKMSNQLPLSYLIIDLSANKI